MVRRVFAVKTSVPLIYRIEGAPQANRPFEAGALTQSERPVARSPPASPIRLNEIRERAAEEPASKSVA
jgi:hypothetical protein